MSKKNTTTKKISVTAAASAVRQVKGSIVKDLLSQADRAAALEKRGTNVSLRKAAYIENLAEGNEVALAKLNTAIAALVPTGQSIAAHADEMMERGLNEDEAVEVMQAFLGGKVVAEAQGAIQDLIRGLVFQHMNLVFAEQGEEFPEHVNGYLDVPETGKRFCREGAGRKDPEFDVARLASILGEETFNNVTRVTRVVDEDKLSSAILADPSLMEKVREAIVSPGWKSARLMVRDIPTDEE